MKNYIVRSINAEIAEISEVIEELTIAGKELLLPIYEAQWRYLAGLLSRMQKEVASAGVRK